MSSHLSISNLNCIVSRAIIETRISNALSVPLECCCCYSILRHVLLQKRLTRVRVRRVLLFFFSDLYITISFSVANEHCKVIHPYAITSMYCFQTSTWTMASLYNLYTRCTFTDTSIHIHIFNQIRWTFTFLWSNTHYY